MGIESKRLQGWGSKAAATVLAGMAAAAVACALATAAPSTALALDGYPDLATVQKNGSANEIMWPDGQWVKSENENEYIWKTYIKGDNSHYGHYDAKLTFTVEDDVLTAIDLTSEGTTVGGKWGTLTPHSGSGLLGFLPEGVKSTTDVSSYATDQTIKTVGITGAGDGVTSAGGRGAAATYPDSAINGYGGCTVNSIALRKVDASGQVATYDWTDPDDGDVEKRPVGYDVTKAEELAYETTGGRGGGTTIAYRDIMSNDVKNATVEWDSKAKSLKVLDTQTGYNVLCIEYKIGDYYVFETRYALDNSAGAKAYAEEKTDMAVEPTGIGAKDRDVYTAAAFNLIVRKELASWLAYEENNGELEDIDIVSAATKSSDSIIEGLYATQGFYYPVSNHDEVDKATSVDEWGQKFSRVSNLLKVTIDGKELADDATKVSYDDKGNRVLTNALFGDDVAVAGFDLYTVDGELSNADMWRLSKNKSDEDKKAAGSKANYLTNYVSTTGHGLVGAYGVAPVKEGPSQSYRDRNNPVDDTLSDDVIAYDPETKALTIKDPSITHVVVQYAVGKFSDSAGGVCGVTYELAVPDWTRLAGEGRYDTMAKVVKAGFDTSEYAVVATGSDFPDALAASALAGAYDAPVVLTKKTELSEQAAETLKSLQVKKAFVMGGEAAVSQAAEDAIKALNIEVTRVAGKNRYTTSVETLKQVKQKAGAFDTVIIARGNNFADSLSVSPYAYAATTPIVLASNKTGLSEDSLNAIKAEASVKNIVIVGGTSAVPASVEQQLAGYHITRLAGNSRYDTAAEIIKWELAKGMTIKNAAVATGSKFPDALAGAALCGKNNSVIALASDKNQQAVDVLAQVKPLLRHGYDLGGEAAVSKALAQSAADKTDALFAEPAQNQAVGVG